MTDRTGETTARLAKRLAERTARGARYFDLVLLAAAAGFVLLALAYAPQVPASALFTLESLVEILPFLVASVVIAAGARATGFDRQIAAVFSGHPVKAILLAAAFGALSPFCSCGVIPIIAALLGVGVPLAPVMAFWLASPLMDPEMFLLMLGVFGLEFTLAKAASALALGLLGGFATYFLARAGGFAEPLRGAAPPSCGSSCSPAIETPPVVWTFWREPERRHRFVEGAREIGFFLFKWLLLAFFAESLMLAYIPAELIASLLGGTHWWSLPAAVAVGVPAYLNGYAAIPTVSSLIDLGMAPGAGLGFMLAGGVTSIPAAMAVFALVKHRVFAWYVALGLGGSLLMAYAASLVLWPS